jgi:hypothetical protein
VQEEYTEGKVDGEEDGSEEDEPSGSAKKAKVVREQRVDNI